MRNRSSVEVSTKVRRKVVAHCRKTRSKVYVFVEDTLLAAIERHKANECEVSKPLQTNE
jgi:hypothetical protein